MNWLVPRSKLTPDQLRAVEMNIERHRAVIGSPRSGKTNVLLYRARHLIDNYPVPIGKYRIFVSSNAQKEYLRPALNEMDIPIYCVTTLDDWYQKLCDSYRKEMKSKARKSFVKTFSAAFDIWGRELGLLDEGDLKFLRNRLNFDKWIDQFYDSEMANRLERNDKFAISKIALNMTKLMTESKFLYDFILVDDGQDLDKSAYGVLKTASMHVTTFMDSKQQSSDTGAGEKEILSELGLRRPNVNLLDIYGGPAHIAPVAAAFVGEELERAAFLTQYPIIEKGERQRPLLYLARDDKDEINRLAEVARSCIGNGDRVAILFTRLYDRHIYIEGLRNAGLMVDEIENEKEIDFNNGRPKAMACEKAKSLTFDTALMPGLESESRMPLLGTASVTQEELFLGITRAERWVYFSAIEKECPYLDRFEELEWEGKLTIQLSGPVKPEPIQTDEPNEPEDLSDLF